MRFFLLVITTLAIAAGCSRGGSKPDPFAGLEVHSDLTALRHLAEVDDGGWYVDFGTPAQSKYTVGDWRSGWVGKGVDGDTTYAHVGMRGRVYFEADTPAPLVARVRLRPHGTRTSTTNSSTRFTSARVTGLSTTTSSSRRSTCRPARTTCC
jgi:hypothetical protein